MSLCVPHHSLTPIARASHSLRSQAGDLIDNTIGVRFGLATLTAAAYGQVISDVSGVMSGGVVEAAVTRAGLPVPNLTQAQKQLRVVRFTATGGAACGVVVGCLLGMLSLFFLDLEAAERQKRAKELETIFVTVMGEGHRLVAAERCALFLVDHEKQVTLTLTPCSWWTTRSRSGCCKIDPWAHFDCIAHNVCLGCTRRNLVASCNLVCVACTVILVSLQTVVRQ